jgi:hypothetical protein
MVVERELERLTVEGDSSNAVVAFFFLFLC